MNDDESIDAVAAQLSHVTQVFATRSGGSFTAISDVSITVARGEFLSVVGPSGCGKSTIVDILSGLKRPAAGDAYVLGKRVTGVDRRVGVIFQRDALLPWKSARQNVELPLRFRGVSRGEAVERAREWLARVGLGNFENSYPHQLSGGMRKRVAIAATLAYEPELLVMDEPFSALDVQTRNLMENDLLSLWAGSNRSVVFITHDLEEAVGLSDRVITLTASPGRVRGDYTVPLGRPRDLLEDKLTPAFAKSYREIWDDLKEEVFRAYARDSGAE